LARTVAGILAEPTFAMRPGVEDFGELAWTHQLTIVEAGVREQARRQEESAARQARWIAYVSLAVAVAVVATALIFGLLDYYDERSWQDQEVEILREIRDLLRR
jgi:cytochrome c-type biogenesis protein CcmH/NrfG